ncbi:MAG TPA: M56 family metallopeptidase, partial [Planctomycetaceae bacterium]|nr:M56 family metallopeptidase [Planctomycetaceae bacterium]
ENAEILRHVLRHELVHVGRRDAWGTLLFNVSFLFLFFHPAFWWLRSRARMSAELVADEWAATRSSRDEYARELIAFVRATRRASFLPAGATGVLGSTTPFSRRIEMLVRRERPLVMQSSPAWRLASCGMLGLLIVGMAASLGRTAQQEQEVIKKVETTSDPETIVVRVDDDDLVADSQDKIVELKEVGDESASDEHMEKLAEKYEALVRQSAQLQKQIAVLRKALAEVKAAGHGQKSAHAGQVHAWTLKDGNLVDAEGLKELGALKELRGSLKELQALKEMPHVMQFDVKMLEDGAAESKSGEKSSKELKELKGKLEKAKKHAVIIKKEKISKGENAGDKHEEEATIELKTDGGEMIIEVGPDHVAKVKKLKGFGKDSAELEQALKALKGMKAGVVPADQLKELVESAKTLHHLHIEREKKESKHEEGESAKEQTEEQQFKVQIAPAVRAKVEAQRKVIRQLEQQLGKMHELSESSESAPKTGEPAPEKTRQRHVIVKAVPGSPSAGAVEKPVQEQILRDLKHAALAGQPKVKVFVQEGKEGIPTFSGDGILSKTITSDAKPKHLAKIVEERASSGALGGESSTDLMHLAELVSNAVGELEQAKAALEDAQGNLNVARARVKSAERKVRLLSRIAQSVHTVVAAQAKRLHQLHERNAVPASAVEEIDSKLRIIDLILSDVKTAGLPPTVSTMTASESSLLAVPALPVTPAAPVSAPAPAAPRPAIAPAAPKVSVAPAAPLAVASVLSVTPVAAVAPKVVAAPVAPVAKLPATPAAPATPAKAVAPAAPAKAPAKPAAVGPQSNLTRDFSYFVGQTR